MWPRLTASTRVLSDIATCAGTCDKHAASVCMRMPLPVIGGFTQDEGVALGAMLSSGQGRHSLNLNESIHGFLLANGAPCIIRRYQIALQFMHAFCECVMLIASLDGPPAWSDSSGAAVVALDTALKSPQGVPPVQCASKYLCWMAPQRRHFSIGVKHCVEQ